MFGSRMTKPELRIGKLDLFKSAGWKSRARCQTPALHAVQNRRIDGA